MIDLDFITRNLEAGQKNLEEIKYCLDNRKQIEGYARIRGMIEFFYEQEVYFFLDKDSSNKSDKKLNLISSTNTSIDETLKSANFYGSRNSYRFVPIRKDYFEKKKNYSYLEPTDNTCDEDFEVSVAKFYDFTQELKVMDFSIDKFKYDLLQKLKEHFVNKTQTKSLNEIKVNELLEIFCIVELPEYVNLENNNTFNLNSLTSKNMEICQYNLNGPTFHAFAFKRISNYSPISCLEIGYNGFLAEFLSPNSTCQFLNKLLKCKFPHLESVSEIYNTCICYISREVCENHYLLAEYILLYISNRQKIPIESENIFLRNSVETSPAVLQICNCNKEFVNKLSNFLLENIARVIIINLDSVSLNNKSISPFFDAEKDCFITGTLQFPLLRNLILVDETNLRKDELTDIGLKNLLNVESLINHGIVNYEFPMYQVPIRNEANIIILTDKKKSTFYEKCDIRVSFNNLAEKNSSELSSYLEKSQEYFYENKKHIFKFYVSIVNSCQEGLDFSDSTKEYVAKTFASLRRKQGIRDQVRPSILQHWLTLARTQALLNGEEKLSQSRFRKFFRLEIKRLESI